MIEKEEKLVVGGITAEELAEEYDTPLYVYDRETIENQYEKLYSAFSGRREKFSISYAVKANFNPEVVRTLVEKGAGLDCASRAEIELALQLGVNPEKIIYTAPFTRKEEIDYACKENVTVNFDGIYALEKVGALPERVSFRIDPGIGRNNFDLVFAGGDSKYGVPEGRAVEAYRRAKDRGVDRFGIHMMTGTNVLEPEYFEEVTEKLVEIAEKVSEELGIEFEFVDIGGGLGIPYQPEDEPLDLEETAEKVCEVFEGNGLGDPELRVEPGRFLVGQSGVLLTRVTGIKQKGETEYVGIDTGMHHNLRPMLLDAYHEILVANDLGKTPESEKTVTGPVCSSKDIMARDRELPPVNEGDLLAVMDIGAYGFSMASHWNTRSLPMEVMVEEGESRVIRKSEDAKDIFRGTSVD